jgi:hypothetical protein
MRRAIILILLASAAICCLALSACGSADPTSDTSPSETAESAADSSGTSSSETQSGSEAEAAEPLPVSSNWVDLNSTICDEGDFVPPGLSESLQELKDAPNGFLDKFSPGELSAAELPAYPGLMATIALRNQGATACHHRRRATA